MQQSQFEPDATQQQAVLSLDELSVRIVEQRVCWFGFSGFNCRWLQTMMGRQKSRRLIKGIYFWGGVGRGKTFLMDIFYQCLPTERKARLHFHDFMNQTHQALKRQSDLENPLKAVAETLATSTDVLCLDEFVIIDIGDAMVMAGLLSSLFAAGVVLVTTSNSPPQNLYKGGLQRALFLPAIDLIKQHCNVINLDGGKDYRLQGLQQTDRYRVPHSAMAEIAIQQYLNDHLTTAQVNQGHLTLNGREIAVRFCTGDTVWFSFASLCKTSRSQIDYLEIARRFNTLILTDIEVMSAGKDDIARRFVLLIDVMYDYRVKLICTAAATAENLYRGERLAFEFERTSSRLIEMQSPQYLTQTHVSLKNIYRNKVNTHDYQS